MFYLDANGVLSNILGVDISRLQAVLLVHTHI